MKFAAVAAACAALAAVGCHAQESAPASRPESRPVEALEIEGALRARLGAPMPELDVDLAMFGDDFFGARPEDVRFTDDGLKIVFSWKRWDEPRRGTYLFDIASGSSTRLKDGEAAPRSGVLSSDRARRLVVRGRALVLEDFGTSTRPATSPRELGRFGESPTDPRFDAADGAALFRLGESLWCIPFEGSGAFALLEWRDGGAPPTADEPAPDSRATKLKDRMAAAERAWFRVLYEREEAKKAESRPKHADDVEIRRFTAPAGWRVGGVGPSPSAKHVAMTLRKPPRTAPRSDRIPSFITESGYMETPTARPKAGDAQSEERVVFVDVATGKDVELKLPESPARLRVTDVAWSADGAWCAVSARSFDREHWRLFRADPATGETVELAGDDDAAWVLSGGRGFVGRGATYAFVSERTGFSSLHLCDVATGAVRRIGPGTYETSGFWFSADGETAFAVGAPDGPSSRALLRLDLATGAVVRLDAEGGLVAAAFSPDGSRAAVSRSHSNRPWELSVRGTGADAVSIRITDSPSPAFKSHSGWRTPPIVDVVGEGGTFPARLFRPASGARGGPGVVFIHGAGYLQNVFDGWSQYQREYAFHHLLAERGFTVLDIDFRGSAGYGRDFRAAVKNRIGDLDTLDVVAAARHLVSVEGADPARMHCYGGSYGGFLTLMALFRHPGVFSSGAALRPVTDWSHYNEGYTANLLDDPLEDMDVYRRASPITYASGLRDRLLICHGLMDDNVLPHDTIRLAQRLIELRKTDFEVMLYPWEPHGFVDAASWSDEYRRILELFERAPRATK